MPALVVIDGNSVMHRAYYALPPLTTPDGQPIGAIYGFLSVIIKLIAEHKPDAMAVAFDEHGPTFRHEKYEAYKAGRKETPDDLRSQFSLIREVLEGIGVKAVSLAGYEADDLLGTLARKGEEAGWHVVLVTGDRDALQLVSEKTSLHYTSMKGGQSQTELFTPETVEARYGVPPERIAELKALMGDASDNIPGIAGVGEKTAMKLMAEYGSMEGVLAAQDLKGKLAERVREGAQSARFSKWLATIDRHVPTDLEPGDCALAQTWSDGASRTLSALGLRTLIKRLNLAEVKDAPPEAEVEESASPIVRCESEKALSQAAKALGTPVAVLALEAFTASDGEALLEAPLLGAAMDLTAEGLTLGEAVACFSPALVWDGKSLAHQAGLRLDEVTHDALIARYVIDPQDRRDAPALGARDARGLYALCAAQRERMEGDGLLPLFEEVEMPLARVLFEMEKRGVGVDKEVLERMGEAFSAQLDALRAEIWQLCGEEFNVASPKQLGVILFEKLGLAAPRKTKTGYSTDAEVLEGLADAHPVIEKVLLYRQIAKLQGTYIEGLVKLIEKDGRVRTRFDQAATATGRISSLEPNLQNIPIRTEQGRRIRAAFCASAGHVLVDADYSQIELRVLAHMSGDASLCEAFRLGQDIHTRTAAEVAGVSMQDVTPKMRADAKAVNFGIIYGISDFGLSRNIGITRGEAGAFIQRYFEKYPSIKAYMDDQVEKGRAKGYVSTLLGRRRYLPELASGNFNTRKFGERAAMNAPIQGTAADIIKVAMVRVEKRLHDEGLSARLILQVHDELIVECPENEADEVAALLRYEMENAIKLDVPLKVDVRAARRWDEAH